MVNRCSNCGALLKKKNISNGKCWKCDSSLDIESIKNEKKEFDVIKDKKDEKQPSEFKKFLITIKKLINTYIFFFFLIVVLGQVFDIDRDTGFGLITILVVFAIISLVLFFYIIVGWKLFVKTGNPGWAYIIPFYNLYIIMKIINRPLWWVLFLFIPFVNFAVATLMAIDLAKSFGKNEGFAAGLVLLNFIFLPILAFGKSKYVKPKNIDRELYTSSKKSSSNIESTDILVQIKKLSDLKDQGILTEEEFQSKKKELLDKM